LAAANPIRWSTKSTDDETGLVYYGFRYYCLGTGRWLSRDPLGEDGGVNLYVQVGNQPVDLVDFIGLLEVKVTGPVAHQTIPTIVPSGPSGTTFHPLRTRLSSKKLVVCKCEQNLCGRRVSCEIRYTAHIRISRSEAAEFREPLNGVYGHEQMHILSINYRVESEIASLLRAEFQYFLDKSMCRKAAQSYERVYSIKLGRLLKEGTSDHLDDPGSPHTHYSPLNALSYPPQPGSPEIK
jgi:RHS repeat-associated protein